MASGQEACQALLARGEPIDAICAASDLIAIGAMRALREAGLRVPQDVAVTGFDDIPLAASVSPALTTVQQEAISEKLLLVHEREVEMRYVAAKDRELQRRFKEAREAYLEIDSEIPGYADVRARISDLDIRIEEAEKAYKAGVAAQDAGDVDGAIQHFSDVQLYWPGYQDSDQRLAKLRGEGSGSGT